MPSPFPGMDPYLESHWRDVHASLIIYIRDALQETLPGDLRARVEERVVLATPDDLGHPFFPDIRVIESRPIQHGRAVAMMTKGAADPITVDAAMEPLSEGYIEIIDAGSGNRVVTIIEVLSPSNKTSGDGMKEYQRKQLEICQSETNLVEIDLLRSGRHVAAVPLANILPERRTPYMVCIRRATLPSSAQVYLIALDQQLPTVNIPLRPKDAEVPLDLQALIEQCYRKGRYEQDLDYRHDPDPPFVGREAEWVAALLRDKGLRPTEPAKRKRKRK